MQVRPQQQPMAESEDMLNADNNPLMRKSAAAGQQPDKDLIFFATKPIETTEDLLNPEHNPLNRKRSLLEVPKDVINLLAEKHLPDLVDRNALARTCHYFYAATQKTLSAKKAQAMPGLLKNKCRLLLDRKILSDSDRWASSALRMSRFATFNPFHHQNDTSQFYKDIKRGIEFYSSFDHVYQLMCKLQDHIVSKITTTLHNVTHNLDYALICLLREILMTQFPQEYRAVIMSTLMDIDQEQREYENDFMTGRSVTTRDHKRLQLADKCLLLGCFDHELVRNSPYGDISSCDVDAAILKVRAFYQSATMPVSVNLNVSLQLQSIFPAIFIHDTYGETNASFNKAANEAAKERLGSAAKSRQPGL